MRLLFTSTHGMGHVLSLLPYVRACRAAGHDVLLAGPPPVEAVAAGEDIPYAPLPMPADAPLAAARARVAERTGLPRMRAAIAGLFVGAYGRAALPATLALAESWRPDAIIHETAETSALMAGDALGVPTLRVGVALAAPYEQWWLDMSAGALDDVRAEAGLRPDPAAARAAATPLLTAAPRALDADQGMPPLTVHRFRMGDARRAAPARRGEVPFVPISFGTMVPVDGHYPSLYRATIDAVAELPVRILVTVGRHADPAALGPLPSNVRVERWVPIADTLARAAAFVTHGGAGTTLAALAAGVPMALLPISADQPLNARLVEAAHAGRCLGGGPADAPWLGDLVAELLEDPRYRTAAGRIADQIRALPPVAAAVNAIAAHVATATAAAAPAC